MIKPTCVCPGLVRHFSRIFFILELVFKFQSHQSQPGWVHCRCQRTRPPTVFIRESHGLATWIYTPQLDRSFMTFFNQFIFDTLHLSKFISRIQKFHPKFQPVVEDMLASPIRRFRYETITLGISYRVRLVAVLSRLAL